MIQTGGIMKRLSVFLAVIVFIFSPAVSPSEPVYRQITFVKKTGLSVPKKYTLRFSLWDVADPENPSGQMLWSEEKVKKLEKTTIKHQLGSVDPEGNPLDPDLFTQQLWVQVDRWAARAAIWKMIGERSRLKVVPYALYSEVVPEGSVTSVEIADGSVTPGDLEDGAALVEIADNDGEGSGLDADLLDGYHADAFSLSGHDHHDDYVNEGQVGSVTGAMILDGEITDDDVSPGAAISDTKLGTIQTPGKVADTALSSNVDLLDADQTVTGIKLFDPSSGDVPFTVAGTKTGTVDNLTAERAEYAVNASNAEDSERVGGLTLADLDSRFSHSAPPQIPRSNTIVTADSSVDVGLFTSITIGADGYPVVSCYDADSGDLKVVKCDDHTCSGGGETITPVDTAADVGQFTSTAIGVDGFPVISYYDADGGNLKVVKCNDHACSGGGEIISTVDSSVDVGLYTSITTGAGGFPVISCYDADAGDLKVVRCDDPACTGGGETVTAVDTANDVGLYTSTAIGIDGFPVVSYYDADAGNLKVVKCDDPACTGGGETISTVDSSADAGLYTSITIGIDGFPVISYYDADAGNLKVVKCDDPACTGGGETITALDSSVDAGLYTSITIGADGFPVISYYDADAGDLKVVKCGDPACSGANEITTTLDSAGDVGLYTSITIGTDGLPVVSYHDVDAGHLKIIKAANPFFADNWTRR
jgi:hypothetical protein